MGDWPLAMGDWPWVISSWSAVDDGQCLRGRRLARVVPLVMRRGGPGRRVMPLVTRAARRALTPVWVCRNTAEVALNTVPCLRPAIRKGNGPRCGDHIYMRVDPMRFAQVDGKLPRFRTEN